jgi:polyhydroxybutyrate depolymerase
MTDFRARPSIAPPAPRDGFRESRRLRAAGLAAMAFVAAGLAAMLAPAWANVEPSAVVLVGPSDDVAAAVLAEAPAALPRLSALDLAASAGARAVRERPERGALGTARVRHLAVAGLDRSYLVQPAPGVRGAGRLPIVVLLHGGAQTAEDVWRETSLPTLGLREGFLVVAPQAVGRRWNDARSALIDGDAGAGVDDVRFLKAVIADVIAQDHGDPSAVFMVGSSNGGFMTMRFACDAGETLRAAASLISTLPEALARSCKSPRPLPWLAINGTEDPAIPFAGQVDGTVRRGEAQPALRSADDTFRFWADRAGCAATLQRQPLTDAALDDRHRWAERIVRSNCTAGHVSQEVVLHGSGHVIPGNPVDTRLAERTVGPGAPELDGGTLVWSHFQATLLR